MDIKEVEFIMSNQDAGAIPDFNAPEYAFIGRSNVGKSSLINMLCQRKKLAKVSSTPGKTQLINHFKVNNSWYLVDLPGYGYARVSKKQRAKFIEFIRDYLTNRDTLQLLFVLIDSRHEAQQVDIEFINWLGENGIPFSIIYTKTDKNKQSEVDKSINAFKAELMNYWDELPPSFRTSSKTGMGRDRLLSYIGEINDQFNQKR
jgi:GTP-binding protein